MEKIISNTIKSVLIGFIIAIISGYMFSITKYYYEGEELSEQTNWSIAKEEFNFKIGLVSGAITTMLFLFVVYDDRNRAILLVKGKDFKNSLSKIKLQKSNTFEVNPFKTMFNSDGRMGRLEYIVKLLLLKLFCYAVFSIFGELVEGVVQKIILVSTLGLFYFVMLSILITKRLHDMNLSPWSIFIASILIGMSFPLFELETFLNIVSVIYVFFFVIILTFYPGSKSENKYGIKP